MREAVIISACRTPIGKFLGGLASLSAPELGAVAIGEAVRRAGVEADAVDEVIMGNVLSAGLGQAPARQAALKAGLSSSVAALTVNKVCGSGLKAVMLAAQAVQLGDADFVVAGGMESMSRAPHLVRGAREGFKFGDQQLVDSMLNDGLVCAFDQCHMGMQAEHIARTRGVSRQDQDRFAAESQRRSAEAAEAGAFDAELVCVRVRERGGERVVDKDEGPRPQTNESGLANLRPAFDREGTVTAGNASTLSDGAAAVVVTSRARADALGIKPLARIVAHATAGVDPNEIFIAPALAIPKAIKKAGLEPEAIELVELNEAFAAQMVACIRALELDDKTVNVHGGAIALGHPIGASGARVLVTLLYGLQRRGAKRGVASLCLGGGNAVAMVVERD